MTKNLWFLCLSWYLYKPCYNFFGCNIRCVFSSCKYFLYCFIEYVVQHNNEVVSFLPIYSSIPFKKQ